MFLQRGLWLSPPIPTPGASLSSTVSVPRAVSSNPHDGSRKRGLTMVFILSGSDISEASPTLFNEKEPRPAASAPRDGAEV